MFLIAVVTSRLVKGPVGKSSKSDMYFSRSHLPGICGMADCLRSSLDSCITNVTLSQQWSVSWDRCVVCQACGQHAPLGISHVSCRCVGSLFMLAQYAQTWQN